MEETKGENPKREEPPKKEDPTKEEEQQHESAETHEVAKEEPAAKTPEAVSEVTEQKGETPDDAAVDEAEKKKDSPQEKDEAKDGVKMTDDEKKRKGSPADTAENSANKRERRSRKSAETFQPDDFVHTDRSVHIIDGRGKKLGELKACRDSIEQYTGTSDEAQLMHKLLFTQRGKPPKKDVKANILEFSGYLPKKEKGLDKEEQDKKDEEEEAKMGAKAYKLTIPQLKSLCDFLAVDRTSCSTKDAIIDALLDFLGQPSNDALKKTKGASAAKKAKTSKSQSASATKDDDDGGSYSDIGKDEIIKEGDEPTDEALRKWVRAYVRCHNMKKSNIKNALEIAGEKFGTDLSDKKARLKELLTEEM